MNEKTLDLIKNLLMDGIIQESSSSFCSPAFPILKRNGDIRLVLDCRKLNRLTCKDPYIFPKIWDIFVAIKDSEIISKLDLKSGYYQIMMDPGVENIRNFA